ncbi:Peptidyl-prolyl cis-trans isomerase FKBP35 (PfFKBP35) [Durusdinium trenchii]|uniref:peptidylprolyl isomerase n=1 Tax=Durusdinium trenchii TaxID=1381693 RepID=A0ABP0NBM5_9DINO
MLDVGVDLLGNGQLLKKVLREGHGEVPKVGERVKVHYVCRACDELLDDSRGRGEPMCFALGQGEVIAAWESALPSMRCGELATLLVHPEMAYGEAEIANIPHGSSLHYELELLEISPQVSLAKEDLSPEERLLGASKAKEEGNLRFKVGHFKDASGAYLEALYLLGHEASSDSRAEEGLWSDVLRAAERRSLALACQLNLCQSLLKLEEYQAAMQYADAALELHAGHSKALYRRGLAAMGLGHWASAKADLLAAAKKEPRSGEIRRSLEECQERMAREKSDARDAYGGFLARDPLDRSTRPPAPQPAE